MFVISLTNQLRLSTQPVGLASLLEFDALPKAREGERAKTLRDPAPVCRISIYIGVLFVFRKEIYFSRTFKRDLTH